MTDGCFYYDEYGRKVLDRYLAEQEEPEDEGDEQDWNDRRAEDRWEREHDYD